MLAVFVRIQLKDPASSSLDVSPKDRSIHRAFNSLRCLQPETTCMYPRMHSDVSLESGPYVKRNDGRYSDHGDRPRWIRFYYFSDTSDGFSMDVGILEPEAYTVSLSRPVDTLSSLPSCE